MPFLDSHYAESCVGTVSILRFLYLRDPMDHLQNLLGNQSQALPQSPGTGISRNEASNLFGVSTKS